MSDGKHRHPGSPSEEVAEQVMVNTISFIQANLQHSIAASRIITRAVGGKEIHMALIQEPWYRGNCIRGLNIPGYTLCSAGGKIDPELVSMNILCYQDSLVGTW